MPPINNGYGATTSFTSPPVVGGYGGGLPNQNKTGYGAPAEKKSNAFDDLDDMFGIGGSNKHLFLINFIKINILILNRHSSS